MVTIYLLILHTGVLSATNTEYTEGDGIDIDSNNTISLDIAQASVIGGVKINGNNLSIDSTYRCFICSKHRIY